MAPRNEPHSLHESISNDSVAKTTANARPPAHLSQRPYTAQSEFPRHQPWFDGARLTRRTVSSTELDWGPQRKVYTSLDEDGTLSAASDPINASGGLVPRSPNHDTSWEHWADRQQTFGHDSDQVSQIIYPLLGSPESIDSHDPAPTLTLTQVRRQSHSPNSLPVLPVEDTLSATSREARVGVQVEVQSPCTIDAQNTGALGMQFFRSSGPAVQKVATTSQPAGAVDSATVGSSNQDSTSSKQASYSDFDSNILSTAAHSSSSLTSDIAAERSSGRLNQQCQTQSRGGTSEQSGTRFRPLVDPSNQSTTEDSEVPNPFAGESPRTRSDGDGETEEQRFHEDAKMIDPFAPEPSNISDDRLDQQSDERGGRSRQVSVGRTRGTDRGEIGSSHLRRFEGDVLRGQPADSHVDAHSEFVAMSFARKLRRFRKDTDEVLFKRTAFMQQYAQFEATRRHFNRSVIRVTSALQMAPQDDANVVKPDHDTQQLALNLRDSASSETSSEVVGSDSFGTGQSPRTNSVMRTQGERFSIAQQQLVKDFRALQEQEERVKSAMEELNNFEYHLSRLEEEVSKQLHSADFLGKLREDMLNEDLSAAESEPQHAAPSQTPSIVGELFHWMGEVNIQLERLQDLDYNYSEGLVKRDIQRDREEPVEPTDDDFELSYRQRREDVVRALQEAREAVIDLGVRCKSAGLDPDDYRMARSVYSDSIALSAPVEMRSLSPPANDVKLNMQRNMSPAGHGKSLQKIEEWRHNIAAQSDPDGHDPDTYESLATYD